MVFSDFNLLQAYALKNIEVCQLHERLSSLEGEIGRLKEMIKAQPPGFRKVVASELNNLRANWNE
ncbi:MAG: hypothetical protein H0U75_01675 [Legionella sp.]|nr:hypothetical protein [Legionella sp.]